MFPSIEKTANPAMNDVTEHETERNTAWLKNKTKTLNLGKFSGKKLWKQWKTVSNLSSKAFCESPAEP